MKQTKTKLLNKLVKEICALEKGKKQLNAGQAREVLKAISTLILTNPYFNETLQDYVMLDYSKKYKK